MEGREGDECIACKIFARIMKTKVCQKLAGGNRIAASYCVQLVKKFEKGDLTFEQLLKEIVSIFGKKREVIRELVRESLSSV